MGICLIVAAFRECCKSGGSARRPGMARIMGTLVRISLNLTDCAVCRQRFVKREG